MHTHFQTYSLLNLQDQIALWDVLDVIFSSHCGSGLWRGIIFTEWMVSLRNVQHWFDIHVKVGEIKLRTHAQVYMEQQIVQPQKKT